MLSSQFDFISRLVISSVYIRPTIFSDEHSSRIADMIDLQTRHISPQYHVLFDYTFQNVLSSGQIYNFVDTIRNYLFEDNQDWYVQEEYEDDQLVYTLPPLHDVWLDEYEP